jgi:hypothetical protein
MVLGDAWCSGGASLTRVVGGGSSEQRDSGRDGTCHRPEAIPALGRRARGSASLH